MALLVSDILLIFLGASLLKYFSERPNSTTVLEMKISITMISIIWFVYFPYCMKFCVLLIITDTGWRINVVCARILFVLSKTTLTFYVDAVGLLGE